MFKSTNSQLDNSGAFGVQLGNNLGISEVINGNSGRANKLIQSSANNYFKSKLQSYQAHHLHTSGQVNPVYPEDIFGAAKVVGSVGRLTLTTLRQKRCFCSWSQYKCSQSNLYWRQCLLHRRHTHSHHPWSKTH